MYLSNRDIKWAIDGGRLIADPRPEAFGAGYDETSIDLHLDDIKEAKVWDVAALAAQARAVGGDGPEVHIGRFNYGEFAGRYLIDPPATPTNPGGGENLVYRRGDAVLVKPGGFLLWQTKEIVGTPKTNPGLICFVDGKSTRARTGLLVHLTAPTIHAGWHGNITLEIANVGPFHFVLYANDVIAQLTVAVICNPPDLTLKVGESVTAGQRHVHGTASPGAPPRRAKRNRGES